MNALLIVVAILIASKHPVKALLPGVE